MGGVSTRWFHDYRANASGLSTERCLQAMDLMDESAAFEKGADTLSTLSNQHSHPVIVAERGSIVRFPYYPRLVRAFACARL